MNVVFLTGTHPRHLYIARMLHSHGYLDGLVLHRREPHVPEPPEHLSAELADLYEHHFERRSKAEAKFFGEAEYPDVPTTVIESEEMDSEKMWRAVEDVDPDLTISYGIPFLSEESLEHLSEDAWNIHGGLSPQYKGAITHFWPSYQLEPQYTGVTLHELTMDLDGGPVVHESAGPLVRGDGLHELACRVVKHFADEELPEVIKRYEQDELREPQPHTRHGKMWYESDWRPEHLRVIYEAFDNSIVDRYLDGEISGEEPDLYRQFE